MSKRNKREAEAIARIKEGGPLPEHIAIIMDGNGRWAKRFGRERMFGHQKGVASVRTVTEAATEIGINYLTLYTFSTENWMRPVGEVKALMELLVRTIRKEAKSLNENGIRLNAIGRLTDLPEDCQAEFEEAIELTKDNTTMTLSIALSYSGREEIVSAIRDIASRVKGGAVDPEEIDSDLVSSSLYTAGMPDPDLLIRTGGDTRVSNFLLWQIAYTEFFMTSTPWPEFGRLSLFEAIEEFQRRERRFGTVPSQAG